MSIRLESIAFRNSSPSLNRAPASMALCRAPPASLGFEAFCRPRTLCKVSMSATRGVNSRQRSVRKRYISSFAASHDESKASDIDIDKEKEDLKEGVRDLPEEWQQAPETFKQLAIKIQTLLDSVLVNLQFALQKLNDKQEEDLKAGVRDLQEEWQQLLETFKQLAIKMQSISKGDYDLDSDKAIVILKETSENLKIQAEKARLDVSVFAKEIAEESKEYLATAAENSPELVKDIVETFASSNDELNDVSEVRDFYVGIPYGGLLSAAGFISFMLTGSIPAIRFGIILGGTLLALSISSLRLWKKGEFSPLILKGQTAIATILFLREVRFLSMRPFIVNFISTLVSGGAVAFYIYRVIKDGGPRGSNLEVGPEN